MISDSDPTYRDERVWPSHNLGEVCTLLRGVSYSPVDLRHADDPDAFPILRATNIQEGELVLAQDLVYVAQSRVKDQQMLRPGDIVLAMSSGSAGVVGKSAQLRGPWRGSFGAFCGVVRTASQKVSPEFVGFALQTTSYREHIRRSARGTNIKNLSRDHVLGYCLPLPPLQEQRAIAHVLRTVQWAREATEQVVAVAREMRRSLMRYLFTYGPVLREGAQPEITQETDIGRTPSSWPIGSITDVVVQERGALVSGPFGSNIGKRFFVPAGVPVIRGNNLTKGEVAFRDEGFVFVTEAKAKELANCETLPGDVVFTAAGTIGQVGVVPAESRFDRYIISNKQLRARLDTSKALPMFVFYWFAHDRMQRLVDERRGGTSIPTINLNILRSLPVPRPPLEHQRAVVAMLQTADRKIAAEKHRRDALDALFRSLLHALMTGKRRLYADLVNDTAKALA